MQDEENKDGDHPKLWKNFAKALGANEKEIEKVKLDWFTKDMIENFFAQARKSYAEGLASLYTYERQIPEIAETKIQGLKKFYGVSDKEGLEFFEAHKSADVIHRAECEKLLDSLTKEEQEKAETASLLTARYLWNFLSGMTSKHKLKYYCSLEYSNYNLMKNDNHVWDNKHPTAQMLGRWQPWHAGHQKLFEETLKKTGQVNIMVRDVKGVDDNPFDFETVKKNILEALKDYKNRIQITLVPNITNICYGRGVGYKIEEIVLDEKTQQISATKIRAQMRKEGKLK